MKIKAFTIIESMMALIVIMISFTAGIVLYLNTLKADLFPLKTKVQNVLHGLLLETKEKQRFIDETIKREGLIIEKSIHPYKGYVGLTGHREVYEISFKVFTPDQQLFTQERHLIHLDYEQ